MIQDILEAGFKVNPKKFALEPTQVINHLGFDLNLKEGKLQISHQKLKKKIKKGVGHLVTKDNLTYPKMASILSQVRIFFRWPSLSKSLYKHNVPICKRFHSKSLESSSKSAFRYEGATQRNQNCVGQLGGRPFLSSPLQEWHSDSSTQAWGDWTPKDEFLKKIFGEKIQFCI